MAEHTPGPWEAIHERLSPQKEWRVADTTDGNEDWQICQLFGPDAEANARLIAAAPELLAALEKAEEWIAAVAWRTERPAWFPELRAAIAKAKGDAS